MPEITLAVIGAGSSYTPEVVDMIIALKDRVTVANVRLMDTDPRRLEIMGGYCLRAARGAGLGAPVTTTTELEDAVEGADIVITQLRVGGNAARVLDERIPLRHGLIGQETTGPGGFANALRTVPVMVEVAAAVERRSPRAWIINYANPTGIVTEAVTRYSRAKVVGLCAGGLFPRMLVARVLGTEEEGIRYDYFGLNHLSFAFRISVDGRPLTDEEFRRVTDAYAFPVGKSLMLAQGLLPSPYLQYYFHTAERVREMAGAARTRGEEVLDVEAEILAECARASCSRKPAALARRGGGGYSGVAMGAIEALSGVASRWMVANVPNRGTVRLLPEDAVIETACTADRDGFHPLPLAEIPAPVWGLVSSVKNYEQLTVEAAMSGNRETALMALMAHPLVREHALAASLLDELLEANRPFLPRFF